MRRAFFLVLMVIAITAGVWFYFPVNQESTFVYYRQALEARSSPANPVLAVMSTDGAWSLGLKYLKLTERPALSRLTRPTADTQIAVLLHVPTEDHQVAPTLELGLLDNLGNAYASIGQPQTTLLPHRPGGTWDFEYVFHFPPLAAVQSIFIRAQVDSATFNFPELPLP